MKKKKFFFVIPTLESFGGAEKITAQIINSLDPRQYESHLVLFKNKGELLKTLNPEVKLHILNISQIKFYIFKFIPLLIKEKPDIVWTAWGEISAFLSPFIPFFPKTKFIARETNVVSKHVTRKEILFFYRFYRNFHRIIAQSLDMKEDLIRNFKIKPEKIKLINNLIDFDFIENKTDIKPPIEYQTSSKKIVAMGNLAHRKGFDNLLQVFAYLKEENIELFILGDGREKENLLSLKKDLDLKKVHFLGIKHNPYPYLQHADLFVLSSRYEGFPNVLLEAGACGVYSLANNCPGGINEIIEDNVNGNILDITDYQNFAQEIKLKSSIPVNKETIKNSIRSRYDKNIILKKYGEVISFLD